MFLLSIIINIYHGGVPPIVYSTSCLKKNCKRQILRLKLPVVNYDLSVVTSMLSDSLPISGTNSQLYHICDILISVNPSSEYFGTCTESSFCRCTCKVIRCRNEITAELYDL